MFSLTIFLIVFALDAWLWWRYDWRAGALALAITASSYFLGHATMRGELRREGYAVEYKPDGTGKYRWRIGTMRAPKVVEADIQWIPPAGR